MTIINVLLYLLCTISTVRKGKIYCIPSIIKPMTKVINKVVVEDLISEFTEVRKLTDDLFKTLRIEDAVIQSDPFGSPPNWHIAHVTWFFHKILLKYGEELNLEKINLDYL